jgi:membrane-associated PAP2 superfamily phosphatase
MTKTVKPTQALATEILLAVRDVGNRHGLHYSRPDDMVVLMTAFGAVLIGLVQAVDDTASGVSVWQESRFGRTGTALKIHHGKAAPP